MNTFFIITLIQKSCIIPNLVKTRHMVRWLQKNIEDIIETNKKSKNQRNLKEHKKIMYGCQGPLCCNNW